MAVYGDLLLDRLSGAIGEWPPSAASRTPPRCNEVASIGRRINAQEKGKGRLFFPVLRWPETATDGAAVGCGTDRPVKIDVFTASSSGRLPRPGPSSRPSKRRNRPFSECFSSDFIHCRVFLVCVCVCLSFKRPGRASPPGARTEKKSSSSREKRKKNKKK